MELLRPGDKQIWETELDSNLMRTGCKDIWDAVFTCFTNYRNATEDEKKQILSEKQAYISKKENVEDWINSFRSVLYATTGRKDNDTEIFFNLLSLRFIEKELLKYLYTSLPPETTKEQFCEEVLDKTLLLAEYRLKKKANEFTLEDVQDSIEHVVKDVLEEALESPLPIDDLYRVSKNIGYHIVLINGDGDILFDSKEEDDYLETILVLVLENGYESLGRYSVIKGNQKKLSRLFPCDDPLLEKLRSDLNRKEE